MSSVGRIKLDGEEGFAIVLLPGTTRIYDHEGTARGTLMEVTSDDLDHKDGRDIRLRFNVDGLDSAIAPIVGALRLRPDGHWQFCEPVLGEYTEEPDRS